MDYKGVVQHVGGWRFTTLTSCLAKYLSPFTLRDFSSNRASTNFCLSYVKKYSGGGHGVGNKASLSSMAVSGGITFTGQGEPEELETQGPS